MLCVDVNGSAKPQEISGNRKALPKLYNNKEIIQKLSAMAIEEGASVEEDHDEKKSICGRRWQKKQYGYVAREKEGHSLFKYKVGII